MSLRCSPARSWWAAHRLGVPRHSCSRSRTGRRTCWSENLRRSRSSSASMPPASASARSSTRWRRGVTCPSTPRSRISSATPRSGPIWSRTTRARGPGVAHLLGSKYVFTDHAVPRLRSALGLDAEAVQRAYQAPVRNVAGDDLCAARATGRPAALGCVPAGRPAGCAPGLLARVRRHADHRRRQPGPADRGGRRRRAARASR